MAKPILVVTHERSGTHLLINLINYDNKGKFHTIGWIPTPPPWTMEDYEWQFYKDITVYAHLDDIVCKSHHQVEFAEPYIDFILSKYHVIYVKRDIKDVLVSYYKFIPSEKDLERFPKFDEWIFKKPDDIGKQFMNPYTPDPHVKIEPENYIDRWKLHIDGWLKYQSDILVLNYEDILQKFQETKFQIEEFTHRKIYNSIPSVEDTSLPNFNPGKGIVGSHKDIMSKELISKINQYLFL